MAARVCFLEAAGGCRILAGLAGTQQNCFFGRAMLSHSFCRCCHVGREFSSYLLNPGLVSVCINRWLHASLQHATTKAFRKPNIYPYITQLHYSSFHFLFHYPPKKPNIAPMTVDPGGGGEDSEVLGHGASKAYHPRAWAST